MVSGWPMTLHLFADMDRQRIERNSMRTRAKFLRMMVVLRGISQGCASEEVAQSGCVLQWVVLTNV